MCMGPTPVYLSRFRAVSVTAVHVSHYTLNHVNEYTIHMSTYKIYTNTYTIICIVWHTPMHAYVYYAFQMSILSDAIFFFFWYFYFFPCTFA